MELHVNMLIEWLPETDALPDVERNVERVLHIDTSAGWIAVINLFGDKALPTLRHRDELTAALSGGTARVLEADPYASLRRPETDIPAKYRRRRDAAWELIAGIVEMEGLRPFDRAERGRAVAAVAAQTGKAKKVIYGYLYRYWRAGQAKNALLPAYRKSGGSGRRRVGSDQREAKLGRPSRLSKALGERRGIRVTPDVERRFERGVKRFYEVQEKTSLRRAYHLMLAAFFNTGFELRDGVPVPVLPPAEDLPSFNQFHYWYQTIYRDVRREKRARHGDRGYNLRHREVTGDSTQMAFGPRSVYQVDATIADTYLVSSFDRTKIIGRPVVYVFIDVFSRMIVGVAVLLEGPSWHGAMLVLDNLVADKTEFCAEYGITILPEQWPCWHLPEAILADRGEFEGYDADTLANSLNIRVLNTPPYRADWKGIVERAFGIANEKFIHFTPGAVNRQLERGARDYRLDAALTIDEFRRLLVAYIVDYNNNHQLSWYRRDEFMIADDVPRYPIDLWNWGVENRSGQQLQKLSRDIVRLNVLPRRQVSVTKHGIHFERELYYSCELAVREGWFVKARARRSWKITVAYDPRNMDRIYLPLDDDRLEVCHLLPASQAFRKRDWYEVADHFDRETQRADSSRTRELQSATALHAIQRQVIDQAVEKTAQAHAAAGKLSKRSRIGSIRDNRALERDAEREAGAWQLGSVEDALTETAAPPAPDVAYVPAASHVDRLRQLRNKQRGK